MGVRQHFPCEFKVDGRAFFVVWFSDRVDGLLTDGLGKLLSFEAASQAQAHVERLGASAANEEIAVYDFDRVRHWAENPSPGGIDCSAFLDAWNMHVDLAACVSSGYAGFRRLNDSLDDLYDKLFHGNNLPSITPAGEAFVPRWREAEVNALSSLLIAGHEGLRQVVAAGAALPA